MNYVTLETGVMAAEKSAFLL